MHYSAVRTSYDLSSQGTASATSVRTHILALVPSLFFFNLDWSRVSARLRSCASPLSPFLSFCFVSKSDRKRYLTLLLSSGQMYSARRYLHPTVGLTQAGVILEINSYSSRNIRNCSIRGLRIRATNCRTQGRFPRSCSRTPIKRAKRALI